MLDDNDPRLHVRCRDCGDSGLQLFRCEVGDALAARDTHLPRRRCDRVRQPGGCPAAHSYAVRCHCAMPAQSAPSAA